MTFRSIMLSLLLVSLWTAPALPQEEESAATIEARYQKRDVRISMRDGVKLFTSIYTPRGEGGPFPVMLFRTPYSVRPYGEEKYPSRLGPSAAFSDDGFIFVMQDVRGKYLSEGEFVNMRPHVAAKRSIDQIDESSDTYDTIDWIVKNVDGNNGRVGMWGISYPGFYAAAGMIDAHPALRAVSPQAPIADWFFDDFHHHGAFFLPHTFNFISSFGQPRPVPTTQSAQRFQHGTPDGYQFFLDLGPLKNANERYLHGEVEAWNEFASHPNYDEYWQSRNLLPHLSHVAPAVLTVGGWFDAEDLYGPLQIYRAVERKNRGVFNAIVMGPWRHGGWSRTDGDRLGNVTFGAKTSRFYQEQIEFPFFKHHLKGDVGLDLPEAYVFETGANRWRMFDEWPPAKVQAARLYFREGGLLSFDPPTTTTPECDAFVSDPARPVPFTEDVAIGMTREYMTDDQRFAARRPDVLFYQTPPLTESITLAGPLTAQLRVSTTESAADWIVKLIDVFPDDAVDPSDLPRGVRMAGYQMMVRSEAMRGRFRDGYEHPKPFVPGEMTSVDVPLQDVLHTFAPGHRIMIQIQSSWFPLVDRNPQRYVDNIFDADEDDFVAATHRLFRFAGGPSGITVGRLE